ncbi:uncharacterized protein LOC116214937 isoform X8 [Punica granatum]|uniref:Uncharacterized protein LOC116214937 isoform X8 n=1 Tax=Punica granatum TaxID=22663 RepID=A0A6P8E8I2_PUNGR|nr:uncharacterized protein LOC116214937 isoform X8 [Punica granatum]
MEDEKNAFYVVRKGDVIGIYRNLLDCQDQAGSSISSPSVSVYKGYHLSKDTEDYLKSQGLKNALYTINAADVKNDIFSQLVPCPFQASMMYQQPSSSGGVQFKEPPAKRSGEMLQLDSYVSCTLEFDGASRGNPGLAGAGAVLRAENGTVVHRLREGVGIATNNVAEYRGLILGLRYALERGFKNIRVQGDSKLVCMQVQGLWKIKNQNMANLCKVAKELKEKFASFEIKHVLREFNSEADAQANLAVNLRDGQVEVTCNRK